MTDQYATWIFQANPAKYDIYRSLQAENEELWNCIQHAAKIKSGDRVLIWISGEEAGIYAIGTITSDPISQPDSAKGMTYWTDPDDGRRERPRVWVKYEKILIDKPLLKVYLQCDPQLWDLKILRQPRGTNFPVSIEEWQAIEVWLNNDGQN